jgi:hypothetical protein
MRADLTLAFPKACYHQKSGQQTAEVTDKISEKVNLGMGQTKDAKNSVPCMLLSCFKPGHRCPLKTKFASTGSSVRRSHHINSAVN